MLRPQEEMLKHRITHFPETPPCVTVTQQHVDRITNGGDSGKMLELMGALQDEIFKFLQRATAGLPEGKVWLANRD